MAQVLCSDRQHVENLGGVRYARMIRAEPVRQCELPDQTRGPAQSHVRRKAYRLAPRPRLRPVELLDRRGESDLSAIARLAS